MVTVELYTIYSLEINLQILVKYLFLILTVDESNSARVLVGCKPTRNKIQNNCISNTKLNFRYICVM